MATPSEKHEIHCAKRYLEYTETPFYRAFRDRENSESFDSNYAVLKRMEEAEQSLAAVESYYEGLDVTPKFYSKPDSVTLEESRAFFEAHGYAVHTFECQRMMLLTHTSPELLVHKCPVQIFAGAPLTGAAAQLVTESCGEKDFGLRLIDKQLGAGARVSFAYNRAEIPVSFCVGEGYGSAFYLSDVYTAENFRGQGYAAAAVLAALGTVPLAAPGPEGQADRFVGFHVAFGARQTPYDDGSWTEYGSQTLDTGRFGALSFPRSVLFGVYDAERGRYDFPGLEGRNCFLYQSVEENGDLVNSSSVELAHPNMAYKSTDQGEEETISGTVYFRAGEEERFVTLYRVYQTEDGRLYLDGSGNSYGGAGGMTVTEHWQQSVTENGETHSTSFSVEVSLQAVQPLQTVTVTQYGGSDEPLAACVLDGSRAEESISLLPQTQWVLVAERDEDGGVKRTVYDLAPEGGPLMHTAWFLDEAGLGRPVFLTIGVQAEGRV